MSLVDRLVSGFKAQFLSKLVSSVAGAILLTALARLLEPQGYGVFMLALTVFGSFQLVARLGIPGSAGRYVAEFKETKPEQISHVIRFSVALSLVAIAVTVLAVFLSYDLVVDLLDDPELEPYLLVGSVLLVLSTLRKYLYKVLQGFEEIRFVAVIKAIDPVGRLVFAVGLVIAGFGVMGAYVGYVISMVLTVALGGGYLFVRFREIDADGVSMEEGLRRRIAEYSLPLTVTNSAYVLDRRIDTVLVGLFLSPTEVGFYVLGERVVRFIETPMSALGFTLSPMFGAEKAAGNVRQLSRIYERALVNSLLFYIPAAAGLVIVAEPLIEMVFGTEYRGAVVVLQVLGLYAVFKAITKLTDNGLNYLGRARDRAAFRVTTALLNVVLNVVLIPVFGVVGAAMATVVSYGIYTAANVYIVSLELELRPTYLLRQLVPVTFITGVMSAVVLQLVGYVSGWATLLFVVVAGVAVWGLLAVAIGMLDVRKIVSTLG